MSATRNLPPTVEARIGLSQASKPLPEGSELVACSRLEGAELDMAMGVSKEGKWRAIFIVGEGWQTASAAVLRAPLRVAANQIAIAIFSNMA